MYQTIEATTYKESDIKTILNNTIKKIEEIKADDNFLSGKIIKIIFYLFILYPLLIGVILPLFLMELFMFLETISDILEYLHIPLPFINIKSEEVEVFSLSNIFSIIFTGLLFKLRKTVYKWVKWLIKDAIKTFLRSGRNIKISNIGIDLDEDFVSWNDISEIHEEKIRHTDFKYTYRMKTHKYLEYEKIKKKELMERVNSKHSDIWSSLKAIKELKKEYNELKENMDLEINVFAFYTDKKIESFRL